MKNNNLVLMVSGLLFTTNPVFAMIGDRGESPETPKSLIIQRARLEEGRNDTPLPTMPTEPQTIIGKKHLQTLPISSIDSSIETVESSAERKGGSPSRKTLSRRQSPTESLTGSPKSEIDSKRKKSTEKQNDSLGQERSVSSIRLRKGSLTSPQEEPKTKGSLSRKLTESLDSPQEGKRKSPTPLSSQLTSSPEDSKGSPVRLRKNSLTSSDEGSKESPVRLRKSSLSSSPEDSKGSPIRVRKKSLTSSDEGSKESPVRVRKNSLTSSPEDSKGSPIRLRKSSLTSSQEERNFRETLSRKRAESLDSSLEEKRNFQTPLSDQLTSSQESKELTTEKKVSLKESPTHQTPLPQQKEEFPKVQLENSSVKKVKIWCSSGCFNKENTEEIIYFKYFLRDFEIQDYFKNELGGSKSIFVNPSEVFVYNHSLRVGPNLNFDGYKKHKMLLETYIKKCEAYDDLFCSDRKESTFVITNMYNAMPRLTGYSETLLLPSYQYVNEIPLARDSDLLIPLFPIKNESISLKDNILQEKDYLEKK